MSLLLQPFRDTELDTRRSFNSTGLPSEQRCTPCFRWYRGDGAPVEQPRNRRREQREPEETSNEKEEEQREESGLTFMLFVEEERKDEDGERLRITGAL